MKLAGIGSGIICFSRGEITAEVFSDGVRIRYQDGHRVDILEGIGTLLGDILALDPTGAEHGKNLACQIKKLIPGQICGQQREDLPSCPN